MNSVFNYISILIFACTVNARAGNDSLITVKNFGNNPGNLSMHYYSPNENGKSKPLVVVLHGCAQDADAIADLTGWNKIASQSDFYVLYPQQRFRNNPSNCFNWFLNGDNEKNNGECASIYNMIGYLITNENIDTGRIYITGLSAGACMSVAMLACYPTIFKAGAAFATAPYKSAADFNDATELLRGKAHRSAAQLAQNVKEQNPGTKKFPMLFIWQGTKDPVVNKNNALITAFQWCAANSTDTVADQLFTDFKNVNGCTRMVFKDSLENQVAVLTIIKGVKHQYPIDPGPEKNRGGKKGVFAIDIDFHATWQTAVDFCLVKEE